MRRDIEHVELLAALHASGAASAEDEAELQALLEQDPSLQRIVSEFRDSIVALASSVEPIETSPKSLAEIHAKIDDGGIRARLRRWFTRR